MADGEIEESSDSEYAEKLQVLEVLEATSSLAEAIEEIGVDGISDSQYAEALQVLEVLEERSSEVEAGAGIGDSFQVISDSQYAEELQTDEFMAAFLADLQISDSHRHEYRPSSSGSYCDICMETMEGSQMFKIEGCSHYFCSDCVAKHIQAKVEENNHIVTCPNPNCNQIIEPPSCRAINTVPENVFDRWEKLISVASIRESEKFYCPYRNCSALLVSDQEEVEEMTIRESECPECRRLFCARCRAPWHQGLECEEFQKLEVDERGSDDLKLQVLARENKWKRCPNCKLLVDRTEGCIHMTCRCSFEFCYTCGLEWEDKHWSSCQE